jgi:ribulose-phosphate 3-epimerase
MHRTIQLIRAHDCIPAVVLNPATPLVWLDQILADVDLVMVMSVNPGFGGQQFIPNSVQKIKDLKAMIAGRNLNVDIEVDGGLTPDNVAEVCRAGADVIVAGSAVFHTADYRETIRLFRERMGNC